MTALKTPAARAGREPAGGGDYLTTAEAAEYVRLSPGRLRNLRYLGEGPAYVAGGKCLYSRAALDAWLAARTVSH